MTKGSVPTPEQFSSDAPTDLHETAGSSAYQRLHEELSKVIHPTLATTMLNESLYAIGVKPEGALGYDLREVLLKELPDRLRAVLRGEEWESTLNALEDAIVRIHSPSYDSQSWSPPTTSAFPVSPLGDIDDDDWKS